MGPVEEEIPPEFLRKSVRDEIDTRKMETLPRRIVKISNY